MNMYMLLIMGSALEALVGSFRFLVVYLLSGVGGSLLSAYWQGHHEVSSPFMGGGFEMLGSYSTIQPIVSVGASGALMGLAGFYAAEYLRRLSEAEEYTHDLNGSAIFQVIGLNLALGFFMKGIDNAAHVGGLLTGFLLGWLLYIQKDESRPNTLRNTLAHSKVYVFTLFVVGMCLFWMAAKSGSTDKLEEIRMREDIELKSKLQPE